MEKNRWICRNLNFRIFSSLRELLFYRYLTFILQNYILAFTLYINNDNNFTLLFDFHSTPEINASKKNMAKC